MSYSAPIRYKRIKDGVVTNTWTSDFAGQDYTEYWWGDPSTYTVVSNQLDQSEDPNWVTLRNQRDQLLTDSDWTQLHDSPLAPSVKTAWALYRTALRSLPDNTIEPTSVEWPQPPSE